MKKKNEPMTRSEIMARIKCKDTAVEQSLKKELRRKGYYFRANDRTVFGKPDIVFKRKKIAVFCDSEFWHGKDFLKGKNIPRTNVGFWKRKLIRNIERDKEVNRLLKKEGWATIRLWAKDIKIDTSKCISRIEKYLKNKNEPYNQITKRKSTNKFKRSLL